LPNAQVLESKKAIVAELINRMGNAASGVIVDYKGISVEDDTKFRSDLRANGVEYSVVKNTLTRFAAKEVGFEALNDVLNGTTSLATSATDPVIAAKLIVAAAKKNENIKVKAGFVDGRVIDVDTVKKLASLPSREVLIAQILGGMNATITRLAVAVKAIAEKNSEPATEAVAE